MIKVYLLITLTFFLSSFAQSEDRSIVFGSFGTDGASLESFPSEDSFLDAAKIYTELNVEEVSNNRKVISMKNSEFICRGLKKGITTKAASCQFSSYGKIVSRNPLKVKLGKGISEKIFKSLTNPNLEVMRAGATTRSIQNLQCSRIFSGQFHYSCSINNVLALEFLESDLEEGS